MLTARPQLTVLTSEHIQRVHEQTLALLSRTGIRVDSERARQIFSEAEGATLKNDRVRLTAKLVEWAIATAPPSIQIFDRIGQTAFCLGGPEASDTVFGLGVTNTWYQSPKDDSVSPFAHEHTVLASRLGNSLESFDVISTPGVIQDDDDPDCELRSLLLLLANTSKPLIPLISSTAQFEKGLELLKHLLGDLSQKPCIIPYFNPITPLVLNADTSDKMMMTMEAGLPLIYSSYGMSGATTPITGGGTLVLLNAELLAGLVFSQLVKAGTPVILGSLPAVFQMQTMISAYTPQTMLVNLACAEMMAHYQIPHCGTSGSGAGWGPDLLASGGLWMNHLSSCLGKVGLAPFVGGNFDSLAFSPSTVIYANEVIRQVQRWGHGLDLDEEKLGLDLVDEVGPGGSFFTTQQTLELFREIHEEHSQLWPGYSLEQWQAAGSPPAIDILRARAQEVMTRLKVPEDEAQIRTRGLSWLQANRAY